MARLGPYLGGLVFCLSLFTVDAVATVLDGHRTCSRLSGVRTEVQTPSESLSALQSLDDERQRVLAGDQSLDSRRAATREDPQCRDQ